MLSFDIRRERNRYYALEKRKGRAGNELSAVRERKLLINAAFAVLLAGRYPFFEKTSRSNTGTRTKQQSRVLTSDLKVQRQAYT